ncbi:proton-conducting transporter membrane subunit [Lapillicoccus sp.]|uniref:proton-conducting transporter transmembrane domain-containing protein n=1 Tax=Lapillicoccus sp. TaxID=1909287 RepID=UPI00398332ED
MSLLAWSLPVVPAVAGAALALTRPTSRRLAHGATLTAAGATLALTLVAAVARPSASTPFLLGSDLGLRVDGLAAVVSVTVAAVALLALTFATGGERDVEQAPGRFGGLMLLFTAAVLVTVTATTLPTLLLAWEVMGATSYALIGFSWRDPERVSSGLVAFATTRAADLGLYVAAAAALAGGHGLALTDLALADPGPRTVVAAGIAVAGLGKAAQLPFSFWLSRAMVGPSPVSALLHSAAMVAMGGYLLLRVPDLLTATWVGTATAWVGAVTAVVLGVVAIAQRDLKQVLAASTASQLGFVVLAAGVGGVAAGTTQLVAHAATKALLFLVAGAWLSALGTKALPALRGTARRWPLVGALATVGLLSLAGVAPLALWASKEAVLASVVERSTALYAVGLLGTALSAGYAGRVLAVVWAPLAEDDGRKGAARLDTEEDGTRRVSTPMLAPMAVLALGAAVLGALVLPPVGAALAGEVGEHGATTPAGVELVVSALLALAVAALAWRVTLPTPAWARDWLHLETAVRRVVVDPTDRLAAALARFDDEVLAEAVDSTARATLRLAALADRFDHRVVERAVKGLARSARHAGSLARRPQTGQLHQYYLQSVAVLAVAAVLLVLVR